jgi:hypothetical protein
MEMTYGSILQMVVLSLFCLVPWTLLFVFAVAADNFYARYRRLNPNRTRIHLIPPEPVPAKLKTDHVDLLEAGFTGMCVTRGLSHFGMTKSWIYSHPRTAQTAALLYKNPITGFGAIEIITAFNGFDVIITCGAEKKIETESFMIYEPIGMLEETLQYHAKIVTAKSEIYGEPLPLNTPDLFLRWINDFKIRNWEQIYFLGDRSWQQVAAVISVAVVVLGIVGLHLMFLEQLATWQAFILMLMLCAMIAMHVYWMVYTPWDRLSVRQKAKKKKVAEA